MVGWASSVLTSIWVLFESSYTAIHMHFVFEPFSLQHTLQTHFLHSTHSKLTSYTAHTPKSFLIQHTIQTHFLHSTHSKIISYTAHNPNSLRGRPLLIRNQNSLCVWILRIHSISSKFTSHSNACYIAHNPNLVRCSGAERTHKRW